MSRAADYTTPQCIGTTHRPRAEYRRGSVWSGCEHVFVPSTRERIEELLAQGLRPNEIAREMRVASQTVSYHLSRIQTGATDGRRKPLRAVELDPSARRRPTRDMVRELLDQGLSRAEIARSLRVSKATVSYHARRLGAGVDERCARRYDWAAVQRYHDEGHGLRECVARFGFSSGAWHDACRRGDLVARPARMPIEELFVAGTYRSRRHLKLRIIDAALKEPQCEACGISEWRDRPLSLALHHVNGDRHDNRLENLELLCPNCHSLTDNFSGRNGRGRAAA
jgi:DNA-binding CsgD family transcriptional regulator/Zn finger protein HypA/HybF involved in hydrogenase expression